MTVRVNTALQRQWSDRIAEGSYPLPTLHQELQRRFPSDCARGTHWRSRLKMWLQFDARKQASEPLTASVREFFLFIEPALQTLCALQPEETPASMKKRKTGGSPETPPPLDHQVSGQQDESDWDDARSCTSASTDSSSDEAESVCSGPDAKRRRRRLSSQDEQPEDVEIVSAADVHLLRVTLRDIHDQSERERVLLSWKELLNTYHRHTLEAEQKAAQAHEFLIGRAEELRKREIQLAIIRETQNQQTQLHDQDWAKLNDRQALLEERRVELQQRQRELEEQGRATERRLDRVYQVQCLQTMQQIAEECLGLAGPSAELDAHDEEGLQRWAKMEPLPHEAFVHLETCFLHSTQEFFAAFAPRFLEASGYVRLWGWYHADPKRFRLLLPRAVSRLLLVAPEACARHIWPDFGGLKQARTASNSTIVQTNHDVNNVCT